MHGRLKIKSTAQQQAEREAAQKKKLEIYQRASQEIMTRRDSSQHDVETLKLISTILEKNPDVTVLWNYRREIFKTLIESLPKEEIEPMIDMELEFVAYCLKINPKSYYAWHHRCWILLNSPNPNWDKELMLTGKFLSIDERNFHCWDYRRWLVEQSVVLPAKELDFVTTKLYDNFSNFSAWHYRSRLIPKVHDSGDGAGSLEKQILSEEFEMVKNALYVDPQDQSPWFYHRWLLSNCSERKLIIHTAVVNTLSKRLIVAFSRPQIQKIVDELEIRLIKSEDGESKIVDVLWQPVRNGNASSVWSAELPVDFFDEETAIAVEVNHSDWPSVRVSLESELAARTDVDPNSFFSTTDSKVRSLVEDELESIRELHSMEENSKWVILELTALLRITSPVESESEVLSLVHKLTKIDPLRESYYNDLKSRILIENQIIKSFLSSSFILCLNHVGLTRLTLVEWLSSIREIDLSNNKLRTLPDDCHYLICLRNLNVSGNLLSSLMSLCGLPDLQHVLACDNSITDFRNVEPLLHNKVVKSIDIRGNSIIYGDNDELIVKASEEFPNISLTYR